jgi:hypothetical protein
MKLADLEPQLVRYESGPLGTERLVHVDALDRAQGIRFTCPLCLSKVGVAAHAIVVWFEGRGAPDVATPSPRWTVSGASLADLSLAPSIHMPKCWHGFVRNGAIETC